MYKCILSSSRPYRERYFHCNYHCSTIIEQPCVVVVLAVIIIIIVSITPVVVVVVAVATLCVGDIVILVVLRPLFICAFKKYTYNGAEFCSNEGLSFLYVSCSFVFPVVPSFYETSKRKKKK